ncbi:MAG: HAMP domain-containing protein [Hyphomicrobiaceae bacterium]|nr:MAG: HAMP domain-containing protein [Hyphomicrobiaceae bacterium]
MVAETEQRWRERGTALTGGLATAARRGNAHASRYLGFARRVTRGAWRRSHAALSGQWYSRIAWRIFGANVVALVLLLFGTIYLMTHQAFLIDAKQESLKVQSQIVAEFIAASTISSDTSIVVSDPDRLLDNESQSAPVPRFQDFASVEFAIRPERVAYIVQNLTASSGGVRSRVYGPKGTLIFDSQGFTKPDPEPTPKTEEGDVLPRVTDLWTWLYGWRARTNVPVYREIGTANGTAYQEVREALAGETKPLLLINARGHYVVSVAAPVKRGGKVLGALLLTTPSGDIDALMRNERQIITWFFLFAIGAAAISSLLLARGISAPMRKLANAATLVKSDIKKWNELPDFPNRKDEIGMVSKAFRGMTESLYRRVAQSEKFAADVSHELKNPITAVRSASESLVYAPNAEIRGELIECIQRDLKRLDKLITDIASLSRLDADLTLHEASPVDMRALAQGIACVFNDINGQGGDVRLVRVETAEIGPKESYIINGHESRLGQVLNNLFDNARSYSPPEANVTVRVRHVEGEVEIVIEDEGPGIPEDKLEAVFDRFYTDRPATEAQSGKNSGLGLSITREIVNAHGGRIWAENCNDPQQPGRQCGARFVIRLPARSIPRSALTGVRAK